ncbi:transcriptional regulator, LacI family [Rhizobiales bacterium GAS188]|nr:transcriptional regulator, LacI family [Rhizobiales bacterium GAS188]
MVTIKDVARETGVSVTTVSHVVNKTRYVKPQTIERVKAMIAELGYQPSGIAQALKANRTFTLGMIITNSTNPFFTEVMRGVEATCNDQGYSLILCHSGDEMQKLVGYLKTLMSKRIDGLVVMTTNANQGFFNRLHQVRRIPVVAIDAMPSAVDCVVNDDSALGGRIAGDFLIGRGFRRLACIAGPPNHPRSIERVGGFKSALAASGLDPHTLVTVPSDLTIGDGYRAMTQLLRDRRTWPEAIFAGNDLLAMGALCAIHEHGLSVPDDISVIGYDDIELASYTAPPLTTIRQPAFDIGAKAVDLVIQFLEKGEALPRLQTFPPILVERRSVGHAKA